MTGMTTAAPAGTLALDPDRLPPAEPGTRDLAGRLYAAVTDLPILSPHGHVAL
jgi:glucuronate isomerase